MFVVVVGFDALKGIFAYDTKQVYIDTSVAVIYPTSYKVRSNIYGEDKYTQRVYDDSKWNRLSSFPLTLTNGDIIWYRVSFNASFVNDIVNNDFHAPVSLSLTGTNVKATVFLNGKLIGRWLSDDTWLTR